MRSFKRVVTKQLGELLIERGVITTAQLEEALARQQKEKGLLGENLIALGFANEEQIALVLTAQYGFPFLPLDNYEIDDAIVHMVPEEIARSYSLLPIDKIQNSISIAIVNPLNSEALRRVEECTGCMVHVFVATSSDVHAAIDRYYKKEQQKDAV